MNKLYNDIEDVTRGFNHFFKSTGVKLSKPNINNLSYILQGIINSESVVTADISKKIKFNYNLSNNDSIQKRIWRFFNNSKIDIYDIYNSIIKSVISKISATRHNELIVTMDHMFTKNNFVTLMFTLKIDSCGIPIWFRSERTLSNCHLEIQKKSRKKLFSEKLIMNSINQVIELLSPLNTKITFLADRWFFNLKILKHIQNKGHFFCFRAKANSNCKIFIYDKKEEHEVYKRISDLPIYKYHSVYYNDLLFGSMKFKANLVISSTIANEGENWYIVTNLPHDKALMKYANRYGAIEMFFKTQKTNGFYLESTKTRNLHAFEVLYGTICIAALWLNIIGVDYIKNHNHYKNKINIRYVKKSKTGKIVKILSTFNLALTLFHSTFCSNINFKLKFNFKLYL